MTSPKKEESLLNRLVPEEKRSKRLSLGSPLNASASLAGGGRESSKKLDSIGKTIGKKYNLELEKINGEHNEEKPKSASEKRRRSSEKRLSLGSIRPVSSAGDGLIAGDRNIQRKLKDEGKKMKSEEKEAKKKEKEARKKEKEAKKLEEKSKRKSEKKEKPKLVPPFKRASVKPGEIAAIKSTKDPLKFDSKEHKEQLSPKPKEPKSPKPKEPKEQLKNLDSKDTPKLDSKEHKELSSPKPKEVKDLKDSKEHKELLSPKIKEHKESKETTSPKPKETKELKDSKEHKELLSHKLKEHKDSKEKDSKDVHSQNTSQPLPTVNVVHLNKDSKASSYSVLPAGPVKPNNAIPATRSVQAPRRASTKLQSDFLGKLECIEKRKSLGPNEGIRMVKGLSANDWREKELEKEKQKEIKEGKVEENAEKKERVPTVMVKAMDLNADELAAFAKAGEKPGLEVWRIERMIPEKVDRAKFGKFFAGDSYICLLTEFQGRTRNLQHNLFYWIGRKAPKDSVVAVAFRSVQLNEKLGGGAVHHREAQGHESEQFSELFNFNIKYLKGGTESTLNHVGDEKYETRLLHVLVNAQGKASATMVEIKPESLNEEDCFILDDGGKIWVWVGENAGVVKVTKSTEMAYMINAENKSKADIKILKGKKRDKKSDKVDEFWKLLGGRPSGKISERSNPERANEFSESIMLYEVNLVDEIWESVPVEEYPLRRRLLKTEECYILDAGSEIFIWCGKKSNFDKKNNAMLLAEDVLAMVEDRPTWTPLTRISEGNELVLFKSKFVDWIGTEVHPVKDYREIELKKGKIASQETQGEIVMDRYFNYRFEEPEVENINPDDSSESVEIWELDSEATEAEGVADSQFGVFSDTSSYIVLYSYTERHLNVKGIIFFWDGMRAGTKNWMIYESKFHDVLVKKLQEEGANKPPVKMRVKQFEEKPVFLSCFDGLILLTGETKQQKKENTKPWRAFVITGEDKFDSRMQEISLEEIVWNSKSTILLSKCDTNKNESSGKVSWLWRGNQINEWEKNFCLTQKNEERIQSFLPGYEVANVHLVEEGTETEEFYEVLPEKHKTHLKRKNQESGEKLIIKRWPAGSKLPLLLRFTSKLGPVKVDEIRHSFQITQDLLESDMSVILDYYGVIYVWEGKNSSDKLKEMTELKAKEYSELVNSSKTRDAEVEVKVEKEGVESDQFKEVFNSWKQIVGVTEGANLAEDIERRIEEKRAIVETTKKVASTPLMNELFSKVNKKLGEKSEITTVVEPTTS